MQQTSLHTAFGTLVLMSDVNTIVFVQASEWGDTQSKESQL